MRIILILRSRRSPLPWPLTRLSLEQVHCVISNEQDICYTFLYPILWVFTMKDNSGLFVSSSSSPCSWLVQVQHNGGGGGGGVRVSSINYTMYLLLTTTTTICSSTVPSSFMDEAKWSLIIFVDFSARLPRPFLVPLVSATTLTPRWIFFIHFYQVYFTKPWRTCVQYILYTMYCTQRSFLVTEVHWTNQLLNAHVSALLLFPTTQSRKCHRLKINQQAAKEQKTKKRL